MRRFPPFLTALYAAPLPEHEPGTTRALVPWWQRHGGPHLSQVACDDCLTSGRALHGRETTSRHSPSYLAFFDLMLDCKRCGGPFPFHARTQQSRYEGWKPSHPEERPTFCSSCQTLIDAHNHGPMDANVFNSDDLRAVLAAARTYARRRQKGPLERLLRRARAIARDPDELAMIDSIEHDRVPRRWPARASTEIELRVLRGLARVARRDGLVDDGVELVHGRLVCAAAGGKPALQTLLWAGRSLVLGRSPGAALRLEEGPPGEPDLRLDVGEFETTLTEIGSAGEEAPPGARSWTTSTPSFSLGGRTFSFQRYLIGATRDF